MSFSVRSSARWPEAIALSCAASELFTSKFARRERPAIPEPALSCLCRRKHSRFLELLKKFASGLTRARQVWRVHREEALMMQQFPNQAERYASPIGCPQR